MAEDQRSPAERIPVEIIPRILQHLSLSDRKNVKLVNTKWYQASRELDVFQKNLKFVIDGSVYQHNLSMIFEVLKDEKCGYYNLEFHNMNFKSNLSIFETFMRSNTLRIYSLVFVNCTFTVEMVKKIMIHCINLEELHFEKCSCEGSSLSSLDIGEISVRRDNLHFLVVKSCNLISNFDDFKIFKTVYPNIKKFRFSSDCSKFVLNFDGDGLKKWSSRFLFIQTNHFLMELVTKPWIKAEELRIVTDDYSHQVDDLISYVENQKELKLFDSTNCENFTVDFLEEFMELFPNLERLKYSLLDESKRKKVKKVFELVANSKLKVVKICDFKMAKKGAELFEKFPSNKSVQCLDISSTRLSDRFLFTILKTFCNLTFLDLSHTTIMGNSSRADEILFRKQFRLRYLNLNKCNWVNDRAFKGCNLKKLEHLELAFGRITGAAFGEFNFPKLKFLCLSGCESIPNQDFTVLPRKCPLLRHLNVSGTKISEKNILNVCKNLKFLHCIDIGRKKNPVLLNMDVIPQSCPTLRCIQMGDLNTRSGSCYYYNILSKGWIISDKLPKRCIRCKPSKRQLVENLLLGSNLH